MDAEICRLVLVFMISVSSGDWDVDDKIVGGERTGLIPFMISIQRHGRHTCGGTLLSLSLAVTACHCVSELRYPPDDYNRSAQIPVMHPSRSFLLQAGDWVLQLNMKHSQLRRSDETFAHPSCSKVDGILMYDFALIHTEEAFTHSRFVKPLKISLSKTYYILLMQHILTTRLSCWVIGWGKRDQDNPSMTPYLKKARMKFIRDLECQSMLSQQNDIFLNYSFSANAQVCAVGVKWDESDCTGDSGGPVWCEGTIMAIVSYGFRCGRGDQPAVYAKIEGFVDWYKKAREEISERFANCLDRPKLHILLLTCSVSAGLLVVF